jgi:hypothetical protein
VLARTYRDGHQFQRLNRTLIDPAIRARTISVSSSAPIETAEPSWTIACGSSAETNRRSRSLVAVVS